MPVPGLDTLAYRRAKSPIHRVGLLALIFVRLRSSYNHLMVARWLFFAATFLLLVWNIFASPSATTLAAFLACGVVWYWLSRRKVKSLDKPRAYGA